MRDLAIATYIDNDQHIINEFLWLVKSWLYSGSWETSRIFAFHHPAIDMRSLPHDSYITYVPLPALSDIDESWRDYKFINSTHFLTSPDAADALSGYEYVLKTDNDVFLTPNFRGLRPRLAMFGVGLYALDPLVSAKLVQITAKWGFQPVFNNVGSTFLARTDMALQYAQIHMEYCRKLKADEFPDGYGQWPGWFFGVLTMYAGNIAANAFFGTAMTMGGLDVHCMCHDRIGPTDYHIHAWHTYDHFSKFHWRNGEYRDHDMSKIDRTKISDYCLWIAGNGP